MELILSEPVMHVIYAVMPPVEGHNARDQIHQALNGIGGVLTRAETTAIAGQLDTAQQRPHRVVGMAAACAAHDQYTRALAALDWAGSTRVQLRRWDARVDGPPPQFPAEGWQEPTQFTAAGLPHRRYPGV